MFDCRRCGAPTVRLTVEQRYCKPCEARVRALTTPKPAAFTPVWQRYLEARDETGAVVRR